MQLDPTVFRRRRIRQRSGAQTAQKQQSHGFFSKIGAFFAGIFH